MANKAWRKQLTISLPPEDDQLLTNLTNHIEKHCGVISTNKSHVIRVALQCLAKLSDQEIKKAFNRLPPTKFGRPRVKPIPQLTEEELDELFLEVGLKQLRTKN